VLSEGDSWISSDSKEIEPDLSCTELIGYSVAEKRTDFIGEDFVSTVTVVDRSELKTVEFEERIVNNGKGYEVVDVVIGCCNTRLITLEWIRTGEGIVCSTDKI